MVINVKGETLPFATIYIKELGTGTTTNEDGKFELQMPSGNYTIVFQYMGYEALERTVVVSNSFVELNITLKDQVVVLKEIVVNAGKEDPAYTIMRKAIAKSKFHTQQVDRYTAKVYMKGTGELKDSPFFLRKTLEKEGVEEGRLFVSESVSEVEYIRPNTYDEKVISIRSSGDDQNASPNAYVNGSFYEPEVAGGVSPLSPRAFSYYKFIYEGTYRDRGYEISKIRVVPRSKGDNVFTGFIEIVEDYWSIYSLSLSVSKMGINFKISQFYAPIEENVWLPVTHDFKVDGKVFGFEFEGKYLATVSDYDVEVNQELRNEFEVIDETINPELGKKVEEKNKDEEVDQVEEMLSSGKEVTRKQLRKLVKKYEKNELEEAGMTEIESNRTYKYDSAAYTNDSSYWASIRPIPLSGQEIEGYNKTDSLAQIERNKKEGDTLNTKSRNSGKFRIWDILIGNSYNLGKKSYFEINTASSLFNTVDGFDVVQGFTYKRTFSNKNWMKIEHDSRYTFSRTAYNGKLKLRYDYGESERRSKIEVEGGRYINQFNNDEPIHPIINTFTTLFQEHNYMKIYERDYLDFSFEKKLSDKFKFNAGISYNERTQLENQSAYNLVDRTHREYTPNAPVSIELPDTSFPDHQALIGKLTVQYEPWVRYRIYNGNKEQINSFSPKFSLAYFKGMNDVLDSDVDYDLLELGYRHTFKLGIRGLGDVSMKAGKFLNNDETYFMDYKHFLGNRTPFATTDPVGSFRMLDYYALSTEEEYLTASFHYQMRKFLVTRLPLLRVMGIRESFFANHLATDNSMNYTELGYGINYILRIFRVEAVTNWIDGEYNDYSIRIGIAANLDEMF